MSLPSLSSVLAYATHVWLFNGNTADSGTVGARSGTGTTNCAYASDRSNNGNYAISISNGYVQLPSGTYFPGSDMSITIWLYPRSFGYFGRVFQITTGANWNLLYRNEMIVNNSPTMSIANSGSKSGLSMTGDISTNVWSHIGYTQTGNLGSIYYNGVLNNTNSNMVVALSSSFSSTTIGFNEMNNNYANMIMDDFAIFNTCLTVNQVNAIMVNLY